MTQPTDEDFAGRYGPWALVVGASEGVGATFARELAKRGVGVVLVSRRQEVLDEVAAEIGETTGAGTRTVAVDLTEPTATATIAAATTDLEVGTLFYCAGADPFYAPFLDQPVENAVAMVQRNCVTVLQMCHHYAAPMKNRGRGAVVLVTSGAGLVGGRNMVAYGATKAFDLVLAEALWAELHDDGVDVLGLVLGVTDTPALRRLLLERGQIDAFDAPIPRAATPEQIVDTALNNLADGPTCFAGEDVKMGEEMFRGMSRNDAVRMLIGLTGGIMGADEHTSA